MTNLKNLKNYKAEEIAYTLVCGAGVCMFCKHFPKCNADIATKKGLDKWVCYNGIKEWLESKAVDFTKRGNR